jgi:hypothetical protein
MNPLDFGANCFGDEPAMRTSVPPDIVEQYFSLVKSIPGEEKRDPIEAWMDLPPDWEPLRQLAFRYLVIPASSVPSEELFSSAGYTQRDRRANLSPNNLENLLMLRENRLLLRDVANVYAREEKRIAAVAAAAEAAAAAAATAAAASSDVDGSQ